MEGCITRFKQHWVSTYKSYGLNSFGLVHDLQITLPSHSSVPFTKTNDRSKKFNQGLSPFFAHSSQSSHIQSSCCTTCATCATGLTSHRPSSTPRTTTAIPTSSKAAPTKIHPSWIPSEISNMMRYTRGTVQVARLHHAYFAGLGLNMS